MTLDPAVTQVIIALIINIPIWYVMRSTLQKQKGDAYQALSEALKTTGKTITDLIDELAEVPTLRNELAQVKMDWRADNLGAWANHDELLKHQIPAPYRPKKKYQETGPLGKLTT